MKIENDPNLSQQKKILDHHPHHGMPAHGMIRKAPAHIRAAVHEPHHGPGRPRKDSHRETD
jgi:hypothetical protein